MENEALNCEPHMTTKQKFSFNWTPQKMVHAAEQWL